LRKEPEMSTRTKVTITIPTDILERIERERLRNHESRSAFFSRR